MDDTDRNILAMQQSADIPGKPIADAVNLSVSAVERRISKLKQDGIIERIVAVVKPQAEEHCDAWYPGDPAGRETCVEGVLRDYGIRTFTASAMCGKFEIVSDGKRYRFDGPGKDEFGDRTPQWMNLGTGSRAALSAAGDRRTVSAQFDVLCPGVLEDMGF